MFWRSPFLLSLVSVSSPHFLSSGSPLLTIWLMMFFRSRGFSRIIILTPVLSLIPAQGIRERFSPGILLSTLSPESDANACGGDRYISVCVLCKRVCVCVTSLGVCVCTVSGFIGDAKMRGHIAEKSRGSSFNRSVFVKPGLGCRFLSRRKKRTSQVKGWAVHAVGTSFQGVILTL